MSFLTDYLGRTNIVTIAINVHKLILINFLLANNFYVSISIFELKRKLPECFVQFGCQAEVILWPKLVAKFWKMKFYWFIIEKINLHFNLNEFDKIKNVDSG